MRRYPVIALLCAIAAIAARPASAAFVSGCCACLEQHMAQTSGPPPQNVDALFCGPVADMGYPEFVQRCDSAGGGAAPCFPQTPGMSCTATLAGEGIICPAAPEAPAASASGLGILALTLAALGLGVLRRTVR
jgi:hypothetical protein